MVLGSQYVNHDGGNDSAAAFAYSAIALILLTSWARPLTGLDFNKVPTRFVPTPRTNTRSVAFAQLAGASSLDRTMSVIFAIPEIGI